MYEDNFESRARIRFVRKHKQISVGLEGNVSFGASVVKLAEQLYVCTCRI